MGMGGTLHWPVPTPMPHAPVPLQVLGQSGYEPFSDRRGHPTHRAAVRDPSSPRSPGCLSLD